SSPNWSTHQAGSQSGRSSNGMVRTVPGAPNTERKRPGRAGRALDDRGGLEVTTVTLRRARPDAASMLSDLALAARDSGAPTRYSSGRAGAVSPSVPTTSRDDTSWPPTWRPGGRLLQRRRRSAGRRAGQHVDQ